MVARVEPLEAQRGWMLQEASRMVAGGQVDADDIVQDTMLRAIQRQVTGENRRVFRRWAWRVMYNLSRDAARRQRRDSDLVERERDYERCVEPDVARIAVGDMIVEAALISLPWRYREAFERVALRGESAEAVGRSCGVTGQTVRNRVRAAIKRLRLAREMDAHAALMGTDMGGVS